MGTGFSKKVSAVNGMKVPLPGFARQLWTNERQLKWWVKYYIERNYHEWEPIALEGEWILCKKKTCE